MADKDFQQQFDILRGTNEQKILESCENIMQSLISISHSGEAIKLCQNSAFGQGIFVELDYALKRLINGVISTSASAQLNFTLCFGQILRKFGGSLNFKQILEFVLQKSDKTQAFNKTERIFFAFGKVYLFQAMIKESFAKNIEHLEQIYTYLFRELQYTPSTFACVMETVKISLENNDFVAQKFKILNRIGANVQQQQDLDSILYLLILEQQARKWKQPFPQENLLRDKVANIKNLIKSVSKEISNFPNTHHSISYIIRYSKQYNPHFFKTIFENLLSEVCKDYKGYFITFQFLHQFLLHAEIKDLENILIEELWHLWLKNLNVKNQFVKNISQNILQALTKFLENPETAKNLNTVFDLLVLLRNRPSLKFNSKMGLAIQFIKVLSFSEREKYYKFLKKKLQSCLDPVEIQFYVNEIFCLGELLFENNQVDSKDKQKQEQLFLDILNFIYEESSKLKLQQIYEKISPEFKESLKESDFIEGNKQINFGYFISLVQKAHTTSSLKKKQNIFRGIEENTNQPWALLIAKNIIERKSHQALQTQEVNDKLIRFLKNATNQSNKIAKYLQKDNHDDEDSTLLTYKKRIGFMHLYISLLINSLNQEEQSESFQNLEELDEVLANMQSYYEKSKEKRVKKRKLNNGLEIPQEQLEFIHVLTDLLISLLTRSSSYLRDCISQCFQQFVNEIDGYCLESLVASVTRPNEEYLQDMEEQDDVQDDESIDEMEEEEEIQ